MKLIRAISAFFFFIVQLSFAQADQKIKTLFYNLPVDSSRKIIYKSLASDKRFTETTKKTGADTSEKVYTWKCNNRGLIKSGTDSILFVLGFGKGMIRETDKLLKTKIIYTKYFFASLDTAKSEYSKLLSYIKPMAKDSSSSGIADEEASGEGMYFVLGTDKNKINDIDISLVSVAAGNFGLFISYTRSEE